MPARKLTPLEKQRSTLRRMAKDPKSTPEMREHAVKMLEMLGEKQGRAARHLAETAPPPSPTIPDRIAENAGSDPDETHEELPEVPHPDPAPDAPAPIGDPPTPGERHPLDAPGEVPPGMGKVLPMRPADEKPPLPPEFFKPLVELAGAMSGLEKIPKFIQGPDGRPKMVPGETLAFSPREVDAIAEKSAKLANFYGWRMNPEAEVWAEFGMTVGPIIIMRWMSIRLLKQAIENGDVEYVPNAPKQAPPAAAPAAA